IHPGREAIFGYERIRESWMAIFTATDSMTIAPRGERVTLAGDVAWVNCTEIISMMTEEGLASAAVQATNIFRRSSPDGGDGRWRMIVHHASPIPFMAEEEWPELIN
ncbi:MAG TPA: nuclear transport factor 2 family protein, partial [Pyrinomonadaceae bacterium]|nr:nuclear transport factor 2 family protein [Pyrinomonadaceae bacterium]